MNAVITRFDSAAATYDKRASAQQSIAMDLAEFSHRLPLPESIIEHGCGTGFFTAELARRFPEAHLTACDPSAAMMAIASRNKDYPATWIQTSAEEYQPASPADLVASASALHWCPSLPEAMSAIRRQTQDKGHLLLSIMTRGTLGELHELRRELFPHLAPRSELPTESAILSACTDAGFRILESRTDDYQTYHAKASDLLRDLHDQGITSGTYSHGQRLLTRIELKSLVDAYDARYVHDEGGVYATFRATRLSAQAQ